MLSKKQLVTEFYHRTPVRVTLISLILGLTFLQYDQLFFLLFALNIPHFFLSSFRKSQKPEIRKGLFYISESVTLITAILLAIFAKELFLYATFFRFTIHFFEDEFYNTSFGSVLLSILVFSVFALEDFNTVPLTVKYALALCGMLYFFISNKGVWEKKFTNFYVIYLSLFFVPLIMNKTFNSSSWGYNLGIVHSLMWLSWDGFGKSRETFSKFSMSGMVMSRNFVLTAGFLIATLIYAGTTGGNLQSIMNQFFLVFYVGLFSHVFSDDFYLGARKLNPDKL
jgi:hypothetical protein